MCCISFLLRARPEGLSAVSWCSRALKYRQLVSGSTVPWAPALPCPSSRVGSMRPARMGLCPGSRKASSSFCSVAQGCSVFSLWAWRHEQVLGTCHLVLVKQASLVTRVGVPQQVPYHLVTEEALRGILTVLVPSAASALLLYLWPLSLFRDRAREECSAAHRCQQVCGDSWAHRDFVAAVMCRQVHGSPG